MDSAQRQFKDHGWTPAQVREAIRDAVYDDVAACADGCMTEPDGTCEHGYLSVLLAFGYI